MMLPTAVSSCAPRLRFDHRGRRRIPETPKRHGAVPRRVPTRLLCQNGRLSSRRVGVPTTAQRDQLADRERFKAKGPGTLLVSRARCRRGKRVRRFGLPASRSERQLSHRSRALPRQRVRYSANLSRCARTTARRKGIRSSSPKRAWKNPNRYQSEGPFLVAAYQSLTGLDGVAWFSCQTPGYETDPAQAFLAMSEISLPRTSGTTVTRR